MANPWQGEIAIRMDDDRHVMKLTLGALAELEDAMAADSLVALVERFEAGTFSTRDVLALIVAGLRGGGWRGDASDLLSAEIEGGPVEAARLAGQLLTRAGAARGIAPATFWALTPAELAFLLGRVGGASSLTRARLEELAAAYPDRVSEDGHDGQE